MTKGASDIRKKYNRIVSIYNSLDTILERLFYRSWRCQLWATVTTSRILEIGVSIGKNIWLLPIGGTSNCYRHQSEDTGESRSQDYQQAGYYL